MVTARRSRRHFVLWFNQDSPFLAAGILRSRCFACNVSSIQADNLYLKRFAVFTAGATFCLVWMGGLVTSHGVGLSVPDWPNTYGYNMFFFPVSKWIGGIFYEHTHRLAASLVGFLTTVLALWLYGRQARPLLRWVGTIFLVAGLGLCVKFPAHLAENVLLAVIGLVGLAASFSWPNRAPAAKWLRTLGVIAFLAVVTQGILGGLRVTQLSDQLGIFHATLAQLFFVLVSAIALFQTEFWRSVPFQTETDQHHFRPLFAATTCLLLFQLILGATMRHQHAGLAIPDFPAAYGKLWPDTSAAAVERYNQNRLEAAGENPITAFQINLQMTHRIVALLAFTSVAVCFWRARRYLGAGHELTRLSGVWLGLVLLQVFFGAATIWTGKSADIATAHVACGALCLMTGGLLSVVTFRRFAALAPAPFVEKNEMTPLLNSSGSAAK
jgi:cytochrome c oxidase assembly protein subunit 15